jgi:hypothetical protein
MSRVQNTKGCVLIDNENIDGVIEQCAVLELRANEKALLLTRMAGSTAEAIQAIPGTVVYINSGDGVEINSVGF